MGIKDLYNKVVGKREANRFDKGYEDYKSERAEKAQRIQQVRLMSNKISRMRQERGLENAERNVRRQLYREQEARAERKSPIYRGMMNMQRGFVARVSRQRTLAKQGRSTVSLPVQKLVRGIYPNIPRSAIRYPGNYQGKDPNRPRAPGRPKGTVKYPGGVYAYRKLVRAQRAAQRYQAVLQRYRQLSGGQQVQRVVYARPRTYAQYPQQFQEQQQYPQYPQQQPQYAQDNPYQQAEMTYQPPQKRPVATIFKSSGGSPYPPVDNRPMQRNDNFVEQVDMFSGRRIVKQQPAKEAWIN